jgi:hypothetical protein
MSVDIDRVLPVVFVMEGVLNTASFFTLYFYPSWSLRTIGVPVERITAELLSMTQWFASLCFCLGYVGLTVPAMPRTIEALLVADLLWLFVGWQFSVAFVPTWTLATHFQIWSVVFLAAARTLFLVRHFLASLPRKRVGRRSASPARSRSPRRTKAT